MFDRRIQRTFISVRVIVLSIAGKCDTAVLRVYDLIATE